jgi:hypothetical protein
VKWCEPGATLTVHGELHANCGPSSSEHRVLVTVPVVVQANVRVLPVPVLETQVTVGGVAAGAEEVTDHVAVALALPPLLETVTRNVWLPTARAEYGFGDVHATGVPLSSEQVVLETVPPVVQVNDALVDVVDEAGPLVNETVGAEVGGGLTVPESS